MIEIPIEPMLLHKTDSPPTGDGWIHSMKWDGHRAILVRSGNNTRIYTRHKNECTRQYPELHDIRLGMDDVVLDGEIVSIEDGKPCLESVLTRLQTQNEMKIRRLTSTHPAHFVAFDLLYAGQNTMPLPITKRLELLNDVVLPNDHISVCKTFDDGPGLFEATRRMGLEGTVSKLLGINGENTSYHPNSRSHQWLKAKHWTFTKVKIGAIRKGEFGWALIQDNNFVGVLEFAPPAARKAVYKVSRKLTKRVDNRWYHLEPTIEIEVKYQALTKKGLMRSPTFVQFAV